MVASAVFLLILAPSASAALLTRETTSSFGASGAPGSTFAGGLVWQLDFNQANDKLFAVVKGTSNNVAASVHSFDAPSHAPSGGAFPLAVAAPGAEPDIAVDNTAEASANNIYYTAENTNATVDLHGFNSAGAPLGGNFPVASPTPSDICGVGVDTVGDVWIGNFSIASGGINRGMHRFDSTGVFQEKVSTTAQGGPCHVAFDTNNDMYVTLFSAPVWKYTAASGYTAATQITTSSRAIKVDRTNRLLYVVQAARVLVYDTTTETLVYEFASGIAGANYRGIAIDEERDTVYLSDANTFATPANNTIHVFAPAALVPDATATPVSATDVTDSTATLNATVTDNSSFATNWQIQVSRNGVDWTTVGSGQTAGGQANVPVTASATDLQPSSLYVFRLLTNKGAGSDDAASTSLPFVTDAVAPAISHTFSDEVTNNTATLGAHVDPQGLDTTYRFEWGETASYGKQAPAFERPIGPGNDTAVVREALTGLAPETTYHYRVIATNAEGTTIGPGQRFETTNECGLIQQRCLELVSPSDPGRVSGADDRIGIGNGALSQVSKDGSRVNYVLAYGLPDSTVGGEVQYQSVRGSSGWSSWQLTEQAVGPILAGNTAADPGMDIYWSEDLTCGFMLSNQPVTDDAPTEVLEGGGLNMYRRDPDGQYTLVNPAPTNPSQPLDSTNWGTYVVYGAAPDCSRAFFSTAYRYDGIATGGGADGSSTRYTYEWRDGGLAPATVVPSPSGLVPASDATAGAGRLSFHNSVSEDGRRLFFTATSQQGSDVGKKAVFMREGDDTIDISQSENGTINQGARYQDASEDGSKVFFTANYGLTTAASNGSQTANCSAGPLNAACGLYEYDVQTGDLADLTATTDPVNPNGAVVVGVLDVSDDGSHVYFAARGQLVPDAGKTYAQNVAGTGSYNLYVAHDGQVDYVANVSASDVAAGDLGSGLLVSPGGAGAAVWSSQATPGGSAFIFQATGNVAGFDGGDVIHVYRYSTESGHTTCVSCRRDGQPSAGTSLDKALAKPENAALANLLHGPRNISADGSRVFFRTRDVLAAGAIEGDDNLYEWHDGQIALLATGAPNGGVSNISFMGASADGDSAFFSALGRLTADDRSGRRSVYVARVGGIAAMPPLPPVVCDPLAEGSCADSGRDASVATIDTEGSGSGPSSSPSRSRLRVGVLTVRQRARLARGKRVGLVVRTSRPGRVAVVGRARIAGFGVAVLRASKRATGAVLLRLPIRLARPARSALRSTGRLRIALRISQAGSSGVSVRTAMSIRRPPERRSKRTKSTRRASASVNSNQESR